MLIDVIRENLARCQAASIAGRYTEVVGIIDELRAKFRLNPPSSVEVSHLLREVITNPSMPEASDVFVACWFNLSQDYVPLLCTILAEEHLATWHEQVVELLGALSNPEAIPVLVKSLSYRWDYDECLCIPCKALQSLLEIGTDDARAVVIQAMQSAAPEIRQEAIELLEQPN